MDANKEQNVDQEEMDFYAREAGNAFLNYLDPQGNPINPDLEIKILRLFGECIEAIEELKILKKGKQKDDFTIKKAEMKVDKTRSFVVLTIQNKM